MRNSRKTSRANSLNPLIWGVFFAVTITLAGCGSQNTIKQTQQNAPTEQALTKEDIALLAQKAQLMNEPEKTNNLLLAAQQLYSLNEIDWARNTLNSINENQTTAKQWLDYAFLAADIAKAQGRPFKAQRYLWDERLQTIVNQEEKNTQIKWRDKRATLLVEINEYAQAVQERIELGALIDINTDFEYFSFNQDLLWQALMAQPNSALQINAQQAQNLTEQGWYSLAATSKNSQTNLRQQLRAINQWVQNWPQHPAGQLLPADLQLLQQLVETQPNNIAILLPLSGKLSEAGQTILDGFMAAQYNTQAQNEITPTIRVYDSALDPINSVYDLAIEEGAEFIIGPLDKQNIQTLYQRGALPVPTLALNYITPTQPKHTAEGSPQTDTDLPTAPAENESVNTKTDATKATDKTIAQTTNHTVNTAQENGAPDDNLQSDNIHNTTLGENLYQFGLALEDEAIQVADKAFTDGHRRALILTPKTAFGRRGRTAFIEQWQQLGGQIVDQVEFNKQKEYSTLIESVLDVRASKKRLSEIQRLTGPTRGFEPRRRQDIDMIFLLGRPSQARQLKPTLNFHYGSDIPVYATSHLYNGQLNSTLNRDMNAILFTTLPWFFDQTLQERDLVDQHGAQPQGSAYYPLYAFGVDAYHLYPRLRQLKEVKQARFYGSTGSLNIEEDQKITRKQIWAKFSKGRAQPLVSDKTQANQAQ